jgi:hypothetical protein
MDPDFINKQQAAQNPSGKVAVQNIEYYQQLVQQSPLSPKTRDFVNSVINSIKQQRGFASPNQLSILQRLKLGNLREINVKQQKVMSKPELFDYLNKIAVNTSQLPDRSVWRSSPVILFLKSKLEADTVTSPSFNRWLYNKASKQEMFELQKLLQNFQTKYLQGIQLDEIQVIGGGPWSSSHKNIFFRWWVEEQKKVGNNIEVNSPEELSGEEEYYWNKIWKAKQLYPQYFKTEEKANAVDEAISAHFFAGMGYEDLGPPFELTIDEYNNIASL